MKISSLYLLLLACLLLIPSTYCDTYTPSTIGLEPYELAYINVTTSDLDTPISFGINFTMSINASIDGAISYYYPFSKISPQQYFCFRLFNFGTESQTYNITFSCTSCDLSTFSKVYNVTTVLPSRAVLGTSAVFSIVVTDALLSSVALPINLYSQSQNTFVDFSVPDFLNGFNYSTQTSDETVYDSSYWNDYDTITIPWLPFFTHCTRQDRRLLLYDILENSPQNCTYKSIDQIKTVKNIPTTGFSPVTDSCNLEYTCFHVQTTSGKSYGTQWYAVTSPATLYYIYRNAISITDMLSAKENTNNAYFQNLINKNSDSLIPVTFSTPNNIAQSGVPLSVEMKISFFQVTQTQRDIISVEVIMDNYDSNDNYAYTLTITYEALDYFGMINSFKVGIIIYLVVFFFVSIVILLGAWAIWRINKLIFARKKRMHPTIKFYATFRITFFPQLSGTFYATLSTLFVFSLIASYFKGYIDLSTFTPNFNSSSISSSVLSAAEKGRIGLASIFFALFILSKGMSLLIPVPTKEETKVIVKNLSKAKEQKATQSDSSDSSRSDTSEHNQSSDSLLGDKDSDKNSEQESSESDEPTKEETKIDGNAIIIGLKRKRHHVMLICILASVSLLFVVEPSGATSSNTSSTESSTLLMVLLMVADVVVILLLKHFLLREILLLAPITTAFEMVQFILVMRAETFVTFIWSYLLRTLLIVVFRIYLDPILKNVEVYVQKAYRWFLRMRNIHQSHDAAKDLEFFRWRNVELILKRTLAHKGNFSVEFIIFILVNYTTKQCARLMFPVYLLFTYIFPNENQITSLFGVNQQQLTYYIVFWLFLLIPSFIMDVYILNILEIVHGHKLYDYLSYCEYRFNFRTTKWIGTSSRQMDRSVSPEHRSIHNFCFSKQFYFTISVATWGIMMFMSGMYIIYANSYQPFSDAVLVPLLLIIGAIYYVLKFVFTKIANYVDLWRTPPKKVLEPSKRVEEEKKRLEKHLEVDKMIQTNFFRLFFVRENKDWIINNLKNFIGAENFHDNEGYLLRIYQKLVDEEIRESNEKKRKDFIQQKKYEHLSQLTLKDLNLEEEQNNKDDLKPQEEKIPRVKKSIVKPLTYLLYHWFYFAKQNLYLMNLVEDIDNSKLADNCAKCGQEYALKLVPQKPLVELLAQYRIHYAGLPFNKYEWRKFYEKKQQFKTLCDDCKFIDIMKKRKINRRKSKLSSRIGTLDSTKLMNISQDQQQQDSLDSPAFDKEDQAKPEIPAPLKKLLLSLHWAAKSKLMHKDSVKPITATSRNKIKSKKLEENDNLLNPHSVSFDDDEEDLLEEKDDKNIQPLFLGSRKKAKGFESARG